jgi:Fe-S cluster assembly ATPase SufC
MMNSEEFIRFQLGAEFRQYRGQGLILAISKRVLRISTPRGRCCFPPSCASLGVHYTAEVENTLHALSIEHCADTIIGDDVLKGISGGERKHTSVGIELVTNPYIFFLDEPFSGLGE